MQFAKSLRLRRNPARRQRVTSKSSIDMPTPALRDDLIDIAQRQNYTHNY